jgi:hypothetical protein
MTFNEWIALAPEERDATRNDWHVFEPGYWHTLANEAASRFAKEFGADPHILRVCKSLYRSGELIIAVQTDCPDDSLLSLPECYLGFRVLQFANKAPEGVLVDVAPVADAGD